MNKPDWNQHAKDTAEYPPSPLLVKAVAYVENRHKAIDIGAGSLKDSRYLLSEGFETKAIDQTEETGEMAKKIPSDKFTYSIVSFSDYQFPVEEFDLVNAMFALPFCPPEEFDKVFKSIKDSLVRGGIFVGNFSGSRDEWSSRDTFTFHTKEQVEKLFTNFEIIAFEEKEYDGTLANGQPKHWHIYNVIAKKI